MKKRMIGLLLALMAVFAMPLEVCATEVPDVGREDCSIDVVVRYEGKGVTGGSLACIRVGEVRDDGNGNYAFYNVCTGDEIGDPESAASAEALYELVKNTEYPFEEYAPVSVDQDGTYQFTGLKTGLYLVVQETAASGYGRLKPFLVGVPYLENGECQYHVRADSKSELEKEPEPTEPEPTVPPGEKLPQTGQLNWPVPLMAVTGMGLLGLGWFLRFREKKGSVHDENRTTQN